MEDWNRCVPFGLDAHGRPRGVDEVPNGLRCGLRCPACDGELIARHGEVNVHHLAHHNQGSCCFEREFLMRHLIARVMRDLPSITLPPAIAQPLPNRDAVTYPAQTIRLDDCDLENRGTSKQPPIVGRYRHATLRFLMSEEDWHPAEILTSTTTSVLVLDPRTLATTATVRTMADYAACVAEAVALGTWRHHARSLRMIRDVEGLTTRRDVAVRAGRVEVRDCPRPADPAQGAAVYAQWACVACTHVAELDVDATAARVACCGGSDDEVRSVVSGRGFGGGDRGDAARGGGLMCTAARSFHRPRLVPPSRSAVPADAQRAGRQVVRSRGCRQAKADARRANANSGSCRRSSSRRWSLESRAFLRSMWPTTAIGGIEFSWQSTILPLWLVWDAFYRDNRVIGEGQRPNSLHCAAQALRTASRQEFATQRTAVGVRDW